MTGSADSASEHPTPPPERAADLTANERLGHYIDLYKTTVEVQEHFNDIEWRIRGLALTVATFALGAGGVAARDGAKAGPFSLGAFVVLLGLLLWYAFYFVDRWWYHPLLKASVEQGTRIEQEIQAALPAAGMTAGITAGSRYTPSRLVRILSRRKVMHSDHKLTWFYRVGALAFVLAAIGLQGAAMIDDSSGTQSGPSLPGSGENPTSPQPSPTTSGSSSVTKTRP
jgi:hypothetical protein